MSSSFFRTTPMLSSICFMPASFMPQSLPPGSPIILRYLSGNTVVMCIRARLYQTKNGISVLSGSFRSRKSTTLAEISSSMVFDAQRQRTLVLAGLLLVRPSEDAHASIGRGGVRPVVVFDRQHRNFSQAVGSVYSYKGARSPARLALVDVGEADPAWRRGDRGSPKIPGSRVPSAGILWYLRDGSCRTRLSSSQIVQEPGQVGVPARR